jgi:hypothetical protein
MYIICVRCVVPYVTIGAFTACPDPRCDHHEIRIGYSAAAPGTTFRAYKYVKPSSCSTINPQNPSVMVNHLNSPKSVNIRIARESDFPVIEQLFVNSVLYGRVFPDFLHLRDSSNLQVHFPCSLQPTRLSEALSNIMPSVSSLVP